MSARLPGPGPQLSSGRIRVDAGRAIAKLREYQLADRTHWILEAVRAAVASRAKAITLSGDANDIWLMWEGRPWELDVIPRLFDELVSPAAGGDTQHVRLLAAAVNSALGMDDPSYIDVFRVAEDGTHVARYRPDVLAERTDDLEESRLAKIAVEPAKRPEGAPIGMAIHLRRRVTLDLIAHFLTRPPEIAVAEAECRDIDVPLKLPDCEMHRSTSPDVLRLPIGEGVDGFIAVTARATGDTQLVVAEHGVVLARYTFDLVEDIDTGRTGTLPVRVFVDGSRMPTNASRSQVRRDKHPISTAEKTAKKLVPALIAKLAERVQAGDEPARCAAITWIGGRIGGPQWHVDAASIRGPLRDLAKLPLVRNALGEKRGLAQHWRPEIYRGKAPLPSELTAWLSDMLWIPPGDVSVALLAGSRVDERATRRLVRWAKRQAAAQRKFFAHAKRDAKVVAARNPRVRARLGAEVEGSAIEQARFTNLSGEICVYGEGTGGSLVVLLDGRELERISLDSRIAFEAVIDSSRVKPADRYRGVERDAEYSRVERAVKAGVIRAIEAIAIDDVLVGYSFEEPGSKAADALLARKAIGELRAQDTKIRGPLAKAPAWQTIDDRWVSVDELSAPVIGHVSWDTVFTPPKGRLIIQRGDDEKLLKDVVSGRLVNYDRAHGYRETNRNVIANQLSGELVHGRPCALAVTMGDLAGAIAPAPKSTVQLRHLGVKLQTQPRKSQYVQSAVVVSSDEIVPDTDWKSAHVDRGLLSKDYGGWELALVRAMARAVAGELAPELIVPGTLAIDGPMGIALCEALVAGDAHAMLGDEIIVALRKAKLVKLLGRRDRITIEELLVMYPGATQSIPLIVNDAQTVKSFTPMHAPQVVGEAIAILAGRKCHDATGELVR
ncbi:MAG TPA: hypothetical protein VMZ53_31810, partial [Kofleriaceae bacterium]|nr:hypothetical protein [Kofleriaceae bacterium]